VFFEPSQSQFDLRFRLFGIGVRVHPWFWVVMAVLGWGGGPDRQEGAMFLLSVLAWVAACFVSILLHEMGHVFMGRLFGSDGHIVLYSFGGLAIGSNALDSGAKRALVAFAGPLAQFLLLGVVVLVIWFAIVPPALRPLIASDWDVYDRLELVVALSPQHALVKRFLEGMLFINLFWPLLNLLPIWPLDGGQIAREACVGLSRQRGLRVSLGISILVAGLLAVNALSAIRKDNGDPLIPVLGRDKPLIPVVGGLFVGGWFMVLLFAMLAVQNVRLMQAVEAQRRWREDHWDD
jgi:stage IV sporulation protein FB